MVNFTQVTPSVRVAQATVVPNGARNAARVAQQYDPLETAAHSVEAVSNPVGMAMFMGLPLVGMGIAGIGKAGGLMSRFTPRVGGAVKTAADVASTPINYLNMPLQETRFAFVGDALAYLFTPFTKAGKFLNSATGGMLENSAAAKAAMKDHHAMTAMTSAVQLAELNPKFSGLSNVVSTAISDGNIELLRGHISEIHGLEKPLKKAADRITKSANSAISAGAKAENLSKLAHGVNDAAGVIKQTSVAHVAANSAFIAGGVASAYLTAKDINSDIRAYADMVSDLTGKPVKQLGMFDMFVGDAPYAAKLARNSLLLNAGPRTIADAANMVLNLKMLKNSFSVPLIATAIGLPLASQGIGMLTGGNVLDAYKEMRANEVKGERNGADAYAKLLGLASEDLAKVGGETSQFTKALAEVYATQNVSTRDVLRAITTGKVMQDVKALQQQYADAQEKEHEAHHHSYVDTLAKKRETPELRKPVREALGAHTQQVIEQAQAPAPQLGGAL